MSAAPGDGVDELVARIASVLPPDRRIVEAVVPYDRADLVAQAHRDGEVLKEEHRGDGTYLVANLGRDAGLAVAAYSTSNPWLDDDAEADAEAG